jgi:signal transduction histidine kinase
MNFEELDLIECVKSVIPRYNKLVEKDNYKIILNTSGLKSALVTADRTRILQVIYNLVNNAVSYTGSDKTVKIDITENTDKVSVHVIDSGDGIPKDKIEYIWNRYYKVDKNHRRAQMGSGLGLSIVKDILDLHHAQYGVSSTEGCGSDFWFTLKLNNDTSEQ